MKKGTTPIPVYYRIVRYFQEEIRNGNLKLGDRLPSELELMRMFGVSRITIRKSMEGLDLLKLIIRKRAKGTFVAKNIKAKRTLILSGQIQSIVDEAKQYDIKVLDKMIVPASERMVQRFGLSPADSICRIRRIRMKKKIPFSYIVNFLPIEIGEQILVSDLEKMPLLEILRGKFGIVVMAGEETIEARNAHEVARFLKVDTFDPVLYMEIVYRAAEGRIVELVDHYYRGDYYQYKVNLSNANNSH